MKNIACGGNFNVGSYKSTNIIEKACNYEQVI